MHLLEYAVPGMVKLLNTDYIRKDYDNIQQMYQERIGFLMKGDKNNICTLYVDVTDNRMLAILSQGHKLLEDDVKDVRVIDWLEQRIYPFIVYEDNLREFKQKFTRNNLLNEFEQGNMKMDFIHSYLLDGMVKLYRVRVNMFKNPYNDHVEAYVIWRDQTENYIDNRIREILYQIDYTALALIDIEKRNLYFRSSHFAGMDVKEKVSMQYDEIVQQMAETRIAPKNRELFLNCTRLNDLLENMNIAGQYSFNVYNFLGKVERYSYYWFDKDKKILLCVIEDMTKEMETDPVTGALNRAGFFNKVESILANNKDRRFAIIYFNVKGFKAVNDMFGYEVGDAILMEGINALAMSFLKPLAISRIEADRFVVLVDVKNVDLKKLPGIMHRTYEQGDIKVDLYGRCGIFYIPENCNMSVSDMCDKAKLAKLYIPNQYVKPYEIFDENMAYDYGQRSYALIHLDDAIKNDEIKVYYQPIYDASTHRIVSAEALVRWISPEKGVILPGKFIPALEESGHISKLDTYIHRSVSSFLEKRYKNNEPVVRVAINLSRMDLMDEDIMHVIVNDINNSELPNNMISYEVTESAYATVPEMGIDFLIKLHDNGVMLLVDDFGSGVSSFSTIRDYDFDIIKLDMGFIQKIGSNEKNDNIVISLIEMAHRLDMKVVAEGVETAEQADFLRTYGCDYIQGYYFSKPLPEDEFVKKLEENFEKNL